MAPNHERQSRIGTRTEIAARLRAMADALEASDVGDPEMRAGVHVMAIYYRRGEHAPETGPESHIATTDALWMSRMMSQSVTVLLREVGTAAREALH